MSAATDLIGNRLRRRLSMAPPEAFLFLLWGAERVVAGDVERARQVITIADNLIPRDGIGSPTTVYPWELETLFNLFAQERDAEPTERFLNCGDYSAVLQLAGALRKLEGAEFLALSRKEDIWAEMGRLTRRQFPWQRGYTNVAQHLRSAYIYNQGACAEYFRSETGMSPDVFTLAGFSLFASFSNRPALIRNAPFEVIGISQATMGKVLSLVSLPLSRLGEAGRRRADRRTPVAYQRSVLRDFPIVELGPGFIAPLPPLIELRTTAGIYLDVVKGGSAVNTEIGRRFEDYCADLLTASYPSLTIQRAFRYGPKSRTVDSPDLLIRKDETLVTIIECKAKRMTIDERYGSKEISGSGIEEIAKGVAQIWRFRADARLGRAVAGLISPAVVGVVLTLDEWGGVSGRVLETARAKARELLKDSPDVSLSDQIPVALCHIEDLESTLERADETAFIEGFKIVAGDKPGRYVRDALRDAEMLATERRPYPMRDRISEFLPWWGNFGDGRVGYQPLK